MSRTGRLDFSLVCDAQATRKFSPWCHAPQALVNCPSHHRSTRIRSYGRKGALQTYLLGSYRNCFSKVRSDESS